MVFNRRKEKYVSNSSRIELQSEGKKFRKIMSIKCGYSRTDSATSTEWRHIRVKISRAARTALGSGRMLSNT